MSNDGAAEVIADMASSLSRPSLKMLLVWAGIIASLMLISRYNYLLFHYLAEFFSVLVAVGIFAFTFNSRSIHQNDFFTLLGQGYLFVASVDLLHLLSYPGMGILDIASANVSAQLWLCSRLLESLTLLLAPLFLRRKLPFTWSMLIFLGVCLIFIASIIFLQGFPDAYVSGSGLTAFKIGFEYVICLLLLAAALHLYAKRALLDRYILLSLLIAILLTMLGEICFTLYIHAYSPMNLLGHILKIISYYLIYKAIIVTGLLQPYILLSFSLQEKDSDLRASEERFRRIVQDQSEIICRFSVDGRITFANDSLCQVFQKSRDSVQGTSFYDLLPQEERHVFAESFKHISLDSPVQRLTHRFRHRDGSTGWINWTLRGIFDDSGNLIEYQTVGRDMTELHNALLELERSKEYYQLLSNEAPISIIAFNEQGQVTFVNQWHLTFFGGEKVEEDFYTGRHVTELPGIVKAGIKKEIDRILQGEVVVLHEVYFPEVLAGYSMYANVRGVPIIRNESLAGGILIREDVTRYKAMEQELKKANQAKSDFLANISHELRTPMNAILGLTQVAMEQETAAEQIERLQMIRTSGKSLLSLIDELLDLSRIEAGNFIVEPTEFNLPELLDSVIKELRSSAEEKGLFLELSWKSPPPGEVVGDPLRLQQVLRNLIGNGIKYSSSGGVSLEVERTAQDAENNPSEAGFTLRFTVKDTGPGIPEDKQEEIFQPFSRLEPDTQSRTSGTGLGLSISKQIVQQLGGEIWVESTPNQGSSFIFTLPWKPAERSQAAAPTPSSRTAGTLEPLQILFADDERISQIFTKEFLESKGHALSIAQNGKEVIEQLQKGDFDVVLMDIRMPVMDGLTAAKQIRSGQIRGIDPGIPIIALSANAEEEQVQSYREAGINDCIAKPVELNELLETIYRTAKQPGSGSS